MPVVDVMIGRRNFQLGCDVGQEAHLHNLSQGITERMQQLAEYTDGTNETLLLAMAALMMQDEINEAGRNAKANSELTLQQAREQLLEEHENARKRAVADALNYISDYLEKLISRMAQPAAQTSVSPPQTIFQKAVKL